MRKPINSSKDENGHSFFVSGNLKMQENSRFEFLPFLKFVRFVIKNKHFKPADLLHLRTAADIFGTDELLTKRTGSVDWDYDYDYD